MATANATLIMPLIYINAVDAESLQFFYNGRGTTCLRAGYMTP